MRFIKRHKLLCITTLLLLAFSIFLAVQELATIGEIVWNSKIWLPFFPITFYGLGKTITEFKEEI